MQEGKGRGSRQNEQADIVYKGQTVVLIRRGASQVGMGTCLGRVCSARQHANGHTHGCKYVSVLAFLSFWVFSSSATVH